jgi:NADPH-dependent 2,4-dienoyl-CoA reductase/sulfur reductase-like enzyme/bacterioferritin-associated ferredoxin
VITTQVAVVGAGPAGLAAAGEARASGARTVLVEERSGLGGRAMIVPGARGLTEGLMRDLGGVDVWRSSIAWGIFGRALAVLRGERVELIDAEATILATGARETLRPFPGWTLDGVLTLEAGWEAVRGGRIGSGTGAVIVAGGGEGAALAARLSERGVTATLLALERPGALRDGTPYLAGRLAAAQGTTAVERIVLEDGTVHECRMLCVESPRVPAVELARQAGCPCVYQPVLGGFVPRFDPTMALHGPVARLYAAGDATGVDSPRAAAESGRLAARCALDALGLLPDPAAKIAESRRRVASTSFPLHARAREALQVGVLPDDIVEREETPPEVVLCPCTGVTGADLRAALEDGATTADELGRWTRCGTGPCQWRRCALPVMRWLSGSLGVPMGRLPLPASPPPVRPIPVSALAAAGPAAETSSDGHA